MAGIQQQQQLPTTVIATYSDSVTEFTCDLYKYVCTGMASNSVISPYSVSAAMMLSMLGTEEISKSQIMEALRVSDIPTRNIHEEYRKLFTELNTSTGSDVLKQANKIFSKKEVQLKADYVENSRLYYGSEMELLDFGGDAEGSRKRINDWVELQTNNKIQDLIPAGSINALTLIILANAIYFKGRWKNQFPAGATRKQKFNVSLTDTLDVDMMHAKEQSMPFGWFSKYDCTAVELPYEGMNRSMVIILPNAVDGLSSLEEKLSLAMITELVKGMRIQDVEVSMPKFKIDARFDLKSVLMKLGIRDVFLPEKANLSAMFESAPSNSHISDVVHKAFVEVNEEGTEAAAATGIMIRAMSLSPQFFVDRPFLFFIRDVNSGAVLFIGKFVRPS